MQPQQPAPTNFSELAKRFQDQAAAYSNAAQMAQIMDTFAASQQPLIPPFPFPPSQQQQLTAAAMALAKHQQQQQQQAVHLNSPASILFQEKQAQQQIQEGQAPLPPLSTAVEQTLTNPTTDASTSFVGAPTLEQLSAIAAAATNVLQATNNGECSANTSVFNPIGMDTSNCLASSSSSVGSQNQQQDEAQINSVDTVFSAAKNEQQAQNVRRIRRRRPKEELAGKTLHRRNTTMYGENSSCVSVIEKMVDSPCSLGPFSVQQPLTPANEQLCNSVLLKTEGNTEEESSSNNNNHSQQPQLNSSTASANIAMMIASMGGNGGNIGGPKTPICQGQSPPSLLERQQQQQQQLQQQQYQIMETQNQPMEDDGNCQDGNGAAGRMKTCRVCGDSATGYNFNVISCESCKAFFRRNALRPKEFKCPYSNDCEINAVSRRFCQKCRLRKCFMVGMKKEWILSEDQLRRRKNARVKNQMGKDGNQQPNTPSSVGEGSMPGSVAPVTPYVGNGNGGLNPFSPPQQQFFHHTQQQQQTPPPPQSSINAVAAMAAASILHNQTQGQSHSPLNSPLLAAAAAITKLAGSPKNSPTGASSVLSSGLDSSPLATFGLGNSPDYGGKQNLFACGGVSLDNKASPSTGTHSPPSILPQLQNPHPIDVEQRYDPQVLRLAQQQLLKKAQLQQAAAVLRKSSDGLISLASAAAAQQQQQQNQQSPVAAVSPFVEQCQRLMLLGQQSQGIVSPQIVKNGDIGNGHSASILARLYGNNNVTNTNISSNLSGFNSNTNSSAIPKNLVEAAAAAVAAAKNGRINTKFIFKNVNFLASNNVNNNQVSNNGSSLTPSNNGTNNNEVKTLMEMDANTRERLMSMRINKTIRDELGISNSPPDGNNLQQSLSPNPIKIEERSSPLSRSNSISGNSSLVYTDLRNYQLNSKEQNDLNYVKSAFSSMDEELKNEFLKNSKLLGIMTKEQPQSPDDMMCLLDMYVDIYIRNDQFFPLLSINKI
ncbi:unnamed protein product [Meloidogyne enterolobii]|uniref:Uncharacterized protein n=1 Tax=Meloidogyne enterolobii TaxID=390850 RepID=A0ACB0Z128_MELEN